MIYKQPFTGKIYLTCDKCGMVLDNSGQHKCPKRVTRTQHINVINALRSQNKLK